MTLTASPGKRPFTPSPHNLKHIDVEMPLRRLVCMTGVSGSGKSSLVRGVLHENLRRLARKTKGRKPKPVSCTAIDGWQQLDRVLEVDQTPIGKTPRSCPAISVGFWDDIRGLCAGVEETRLRGYSARRFPLNTLDGQMSCERFSTRHRVIFALRPWLGSSKASSPCFTACRRRILRHWNN